MARPDLQIIEVASALGAPFGGSDLAPSTLAQAGLRTTLQDQGWHLHPTITLRPRAVDRKALPELLAEVADASARATQAGHLPLIIGGDHSIAAGTWRGIGRALGQAPGLIWIDAHLDAHTPDTSLSGNPHGMPVALLLGGGNPALGQNAGPTLDPSRLILIGERSAEEAEHKRLSEYRVSSFPAQAVRARGLNSIIHEARTRLADKPWGISLDVDALDPREAPGVSTPVADGLKVAELSQALHQTLKAPGFCGLEIVEFNPRFDIKGKTARAILKIIKAMAEGLDS